MEETRQQRRAREREAKAEKEKLDKQLDKIVGGKIEGKRFHDWPAWEGRGVPTRENCDLNNPRQKLLWMFTAMPGMKGAPLMFPPEFWELQSWRMCVLGAGITGEPMLEWRPPLHTTVDPHMASGDWVEPGTPQPERKTMADLMNALPQKDRADIRAYVLEKMGFEDSGGDRPGPPAMQYTVTTLAERLTCPVGELLTVLTNLGVPNLHAESRVSRDVADRIAERMGV